MPTKKVTLVKKAPARSAPPRSNAGGAVRGRARATKVQAMNAEKKATNLPSGRAAKGRTSAAAASGRKATAIRSKYNRFQAGTGTTSTRRQPSQQLKYGQVRSAGQGIGAALESYGDIGNFLKNLGR